MSESVKSPSSKRRYDATKRQVAAQDTRDRMLRAAREIFLRQGYASARMAEIAARAEVSLETLYAAFGPKPRLVRHLIEVALSGESEPVPALERTWVREARAQTDPARMIEMVAAGASQLEERVAPLWAVCKEAATEEAGLALMIKELEGRRATHMRVFVEDLARIGGLRPDLAHDAATDVIWALNSPELYALFVLERGWSTEAFTEWLSDAWKRLLLP